MLKKYLEVEIEYSGTKVFYIPINDTLTLDKQLAYVGENYYRLDQGNNAIYDTVNQKFMSVHYREERP